ncbi:MAG: HEAT repeat domain-containing protein [Cellvibrionaceae bacterium]
MNNSLKLIDDIKSKNYKALSSNIISEASLKSVADGLIEQGVFSNIINHLVNEFSNKVTREFDWNCGSLLQHAFPDDVIASIPISNSLRRKLQESIGFTWCLGEFKLRDQRVVEFLEETVEFSQCSECWWRAAFSLEKIGAVDAVSYLKAALKYQGAALLEDSLSSLHDCRSRIGVLLHSDFSNLRNKIHPKLKHIICSDPNNKQELLGAIWLVSRLQYHNQGIRAELKLLLKNQDYEIRFYTVDAIAKLASVHFMDELIEILKMPIPHLQVMAANGLGKIDTVQSITTLQDFLKTETDENVVSAISESLYNLINYSKRQHFFLEQNTGANENGMIVDKNDKWYVNPDIYHEFSSCQDPENICMGLLSHILDGVEITNPIDIGCGTGRLAWYFYNYIEFSGELFCIDASQQMLQFLERRLGRESADIERINTCISELSSIDKVVGYNTSSLVMANFAFPSRYTDLALIRSELKAIVNCLRPEGKLITIGWDESFNDELNEMWYKFVPDGITARNFESWRRKRQNLFSSPRNANLNWFRRGLKVNLQFPSLDASVRVMGYLFGRSAVKEILENQKTCWSMSMGITVNTREQIIEILEQTNG